MEENKVRHRIIIIKTSETVTETYHKYEDRGNCMKLTIKDIARMSNVSCTTVSRVLNNKPDVNPETREIILNIIKENEYYPSVLAKGIITKRNYTLGLVIPYDISSIFINPFHSEVIRGVMSQADARGYHLLINSYMRNSDIVSIYHEKRVEGLIVLSPNANDIELFDKLERLKIPYVATAKTPNSKHSNYVDVDNVIGADTAVSYLIALGHKKISMITGPKYLVSHNDRIEGYKQALEKHGLSFDNSYLKFGDNSIESGYSCTAQLLNSNDPPTAIFVAGDIMAIGAIQAIRNRGMNVPEDISILGFDDITFAEYLDPPLTTIRQPANQKGAEAFKMLVDFLENGTPIRKQILPVELIVRSSTKSMR
jgi:LacI family transcriptional regulator